MPSPRSARAIPIVGLAAALIGCTQPQEPTPSAPEPAPVTPSYGVAFESLPQMPVRIDRDSSWHAPDALVVPQGDDTVRVCQLLETGPDVRCHRRFDSGTLGFSALRREPGAPLYVTSGPPITGVAAERFAVIRAWDGRRIGPWLHSGFVRRDGSYHGVRSEEASQLETFFVRRTAAGSETSERIPTPPHRGEMLIGTLTTERWLALVWTSEEWAAARVERYQIDADGRLRRQRTFRVAEESVVVLPCPIGDDLAIAHGSAADESFVRLRPGESGAQAARTRRATFQCFAGAISALAGADDLIVPSTIERARCDARGCRTNTFAQPPRDPDDSRFTVDLDENVLHVIRRRSGEITAWMATPQSLGDALPLTRIDDRSAVAEISALPHRGGALVFLIDIEDGARALAIERDGAVRAARIDGS